QPWLPFR
uniref:Peroniin-1.5 n=1 Tax=Litoria peronii TaxID=317363 RepID=PE15_LITPE|nr:RecName: Full=Peroniin-1.5 [Litoria peronii]